MSRSKRKPYYTDQQNGCTKQPKRRATRAVRHSKDVPNGNQYKKFSCSWNISDYSFFCPKDKKASRK